MQIGFIGLGAMGGPLARNLIRANRNTIVYDLSSEAIRRTLEAGSSGIAANGFEDLAEADIVFTSLPLPRHLEEVMLGDSGLLAVQAPGLRHSYLLPLAAQLSCRRSRNLCSGS